MLSPVEHILTIDSLEVEIPGLADLLQKEKNAVPRLRYQYEALGQIYRKQIPLVTPGDKQLLECNEFVSDVFNEDVMAEVLQKHKTYCSEIPFKHLVIDRLFQKNVLARVVEEFPEPSKMGGKHFDDKHQKKFGTGIDFTVLSHPM